MVAKNDRTQCARETELTRLNNILPNNIPIVLAFNDPPDQITTYAMVLSTNRLENFLAPVT